MAGSEAVASELGISFESDLLAQKAKTIDGIDFYAIFIPNPKTKVQEHMHTQWKYIT